MGLLAYVWNSLGLPLPAMVYINNDETVNKTVCGL
jgi:hypothetical protein